MRRFRIAAAILGLIIARPAGSAQIFEKVGTFDGQFLKIGIGARAEAMGGAFVAVADDPSAVFWNPAGIARLGTDSQKQELMVNHTEWPAQVNIDEAVFVFHLKGLPGAVAVNGRALTIAEEPVRDSFHPDGTGETFDAGYASFGATYARSFTDKFSAGGNINLVRLGLAEFSQETVTFDIGTLYDVGVAGMKIGFSISNIGSQVKFIDRNGRLPAIFRVGTSADLLQRGPNKLIGSFEFSHPPDNSERANAGFEYSFKDYMFLRGGYNFNYDSETFAAGAGLRFPITPLKTNANFDYAYTDMQTLGAAHRLSLRIRF